MQSQEGNERCQSGNHEEWQAGNPGCMSDMRDQDVQDREELKLKITRLGKAEYLYAKDTQLFYFKLHNVD